MKKYFSVGEAAKRSDTTSETLRHYDRIGLIKPSRKDEWTGYRFYTEEDLVRVQTVRALQQMDLPLQKIKEVLELNDLNKIVALLTAAEQTADEKIALLQSSKAKIQLAKSDYERKLRTQPPKEGIKHLPARTILLSDTLETPTLDNLWGYLRHFYQMLDPGKKEQFEFEDTAGIYTENGISRLFAVCIRHAQMDGLRTLPAGEYLCADCTEETRESTLQSLLQTAKENHHTEPKFTIQQIIVSGILQWNYQAQIPLA